MHEVFHEKYIIVYLPSSFTQVPRFCIRSSWVAHYFHKTFGDSFLDSGPPLVRFHGLVYEIAQPKKISAAYGRKYFVFSRRLRVLDFLRAHVRMYKHPKLDNVQTWRPAAGMFDNSACMSVDGCALISVRSMCFTAACAHYVNEGLASI